jgi:hypothetical protein
MSSVASAQGTSLYRRSQGYSLLAGQTVGQGQRAVQAELGWPGVAGTFLFGLSSTFDVGAKLGVQSGVEGLVPSLDSGLKLQGVVRYRLWEEGHNNLAIRVSPGFSYYGRVDTVLTVPVEVAFGHWLSSALLLHGALEMPFLARFGATNSVVLPIVAGVGAEYFLKQNWLLTFRSRMGPVFQSRPSASLWLETQVGVGLRL